MGGLRWESRGSYEKLKIFLRWIFLLLGEWDEPAISRNGTPSMRFERHTIHDSERYPWHIDSKVIAKQ
jgi:hypothetical protein